MSLKADLAAVIEAAVQRALVPALAEIRALLATTLLTPRPTKDDQLMNLTETAEFLNSNVREARRLLRSGVLVPTEVLGPRSCRFSRSAVIRHLSPAAVAGTPASARPRLKAGA